MALRLTDAYCNDNENGGEKLTIVGLYTANERVGDDEPSPIAWKILASLGAKADTELGASKPILAVIVSHSFEAMLKKECTVDGQGKGFEVYSSYDAKHDEKLELENVKVEQGDWVEVSALVADICLKDGVALYDFENQLDGGVGGLKENDWLRNEQVAKLI